MLGKRKKMLVSDESSLSPPADSCTTSVLLGGFTLHLDGEPSPQPQAPLHPSPPPPASPPPLPSPRFHFQQPGGPEPGDAVDEKGRDGVASFLSGLPHLRRRSGNASGGWGASWGSSSIGGGRGSHGMPWQQHPISFLKSLRQGRTSLSSFLGFSGSESDLSNNDAGEVDRTSSCSRQISVSSAAADGLQGAETAPGMRTAEAGSGKGGHRTISESMGGLPSEKRGTHGPVHDCYGGTATATAAAAADSLAMLTLGEISFEVKYGSLLYVLQQVPSSSAFMTTVIVTLTRFPLMMIHLAEATF